MKLADSQKLFWEMATRGPDPARAREAFVGTPALDAAERLRIYANMFIWRQIDALREDYPKLVALLGDEAFYALGEAYLREHPSTHPSLSQLGRHLPAFLLIGGPCAARPAASAAPSDRGARAVLGPWASAPPLPPAPPRPPPGPTRPGGVLLPPRPAAAAGSHETQQQPLIRLPRADLADMAALERARSEAFEEADVPAASPDLLGSLPPEAAAKLRLRTVPALRLLSLGHDVATVWQEIEEGRPVSDPKLGATSVVVWRRGFDVFHARIEADEALALRRAMAGETLGSVCDAFSDRPDALAAAFRAIGSWFAEGFIQRPEEER